MLAVESNPQRIVLITKFILLCKCHCKSPPATTQRVARAPVPRLSPYILLPLEMAGESVERNQE